MTAAIVNWYAAIGFFIAAIRFLYAAIVNYTVDIQNNPKCGAMNKAKFPPQASNIVQYGERINSLISYLSNYQLIPLERVKEFFGDLINHPLSKATVIEMNRKTHEALQLFEQTAKDKAINSSVAHADESGFYCENKRQWLHCASTNTITHYQFHPKRGKEAMDEKEKEKRTSKKIKGFESSDQIKRP